MTNPSFKFQMSTVCDACCVVLCNTVKFDCDRQTERDSKKLFSILHNIQASVSVILDKYSITHMQTKIITSAKLSRYERADLILQRLVAAHLSEVGRRTCSMA